MAGLGVVGSTGNKARGVTGQGAPIGDPFYIDYVAHEMGHQFAGNHCFNGTGGSCSGNRSSANAYEPGSASTIMGYAGICGADDLQNNSDPYFLFDSLDDMIAFTNLTIPGVGTQTATGNSIPTVNAGPNYAIPTGTPFVLTAVGSDGNPGDVLTYCWEERDLGAALSLAAADNGASPIIRSWSPTTNPSRMIPRLVNLLANTQAPGEELPTVARAALRFRCTIRDNRANGGAVGSGDMQVQVVNTGSAFSVTAPNTAVSWPGGSSQTVTWNVAGTTAAPINAANVAILLSTDGGITFPTTILASTPNDGSESITVPSVTTALARVKVAPVGNIFFDISNANFTITAPAGPVNNGCASATSIGNGATPFNSALATTDGPFEACLGGDGLAHNDIWYTYTAPCVGQATVSVCDATFDTRIAVYADTCPGGPGTAVACNDDSCGTGSQVTWIALQGTVYKIRVGGAGAGLTGTGTLNVSCQFCYANCDISNFHPVLNVADFTCFLQRYAANDPYANCDGSTSEPTLNVADFTCFLQKYAAVCP